MASEVSDVLVDESVQADEPRPLFPTRLLIVFLWAMFATTLWDPSMFWDSFPRELLKDDSLRRGTFVFIAMIPWLLSWIWAYLSDRGVVRGIGRSRQVLWFGVLAVAGWAAAPFLPEAFGPWLAVSLVLGLAASTVTVAAQGAIAEIGQANESTGILAAGLVGSTLVARLVSPPLSRGLLQSPIAWTALVGGGLAISVVFVSAIIPQGKHERRRSAPLVPDSRSPRPFRQSFRSRRFWAAVAIVGLGGVGIVGNLINEKVRSALPQPEETWMLMERVEVLVALATAALYAIVCRRIAARRLVSLSLVAATLGTLALYAFHRDSTVGDIGLVLAVRALGIGVAEVAIVDLALRVAPKGWEALGYVVIFATPRILTFALYATLGRYDFAVIVAAHATLLGLGTLVALLAPAGLFRFRQATPRWKSAEEPLVAED